jgi:hypothetical protein
MDAEIDAALTQLETRLEAVRRDAAERIRWTSERHEREWKDAAAWRTQWTAELDALIVEVGLLKIAVQALEQRMPDKSQNERIYEAVQAASNAWVDVLFEMLPADRQPFKERFQKTMGTLWAEIIGGSTVMAAGVIVGIDQRVRVLEEKQVGDGGGDGRG